MGNRRFDKRETKEKRIFNGKYLMREKHKKEKENINKCNLDVINLPTQTQVMYVIS